MSQEILHPLTPSEPLLDPHNLIKICCGIQQKAPLG